MTPEEVTELYDKGKVGLQLSYDVTRTKSVADTFGNLGCYLNIRGTDYDWNIFFNDLEPNDIEDIKNVLKRVADRAQKRLDEFK